MPGAREPSPLFLREAQTASAIRLRRLLSAKGGRSPFDTVMMLKIMVLQALYCLSDDQAEFQIQDRLSPVGMAPYPSHGCIISKQSSSPIRHDAA
ncbi:transposase [Mesorhizobium japonicum MAFF 303099]|uniref:Transposase n=1 Tax=Mesorhizobium japonicum (strain LMG 29417 / CECT 9101 / MAFF 303099) TaxID=266835 RepID=Q98A56_RHILO|nr:transposase [Mesorhizobium japonicum MAFF 303099]